MASAQEKARVVVWFTEFKSIVRWKGSFVEFIRKQHKTKRIKVWHNKFLETGSVLKGH
jgi:hypothetical protein